jgi:hypothetical protein
MDILAALEASPSAATGRRCKIQRFLDSIPEDTAGRAQLEATLSTMDRDDPDYRQASKLIALLGRLGVVTSVSCVNDHRAKRCVCNA